MMSVEDEEKKSAVSVFMRNRPKLLMWAKRFLRNTADVEDVVQETFVRSYQHIIENEVENPKAYLYTTAKNLAIKRNELAVNRLSDTLEELELDTFVELENSVEQEAAGKEEMAFLCEAIRELPPQARKVFVLKKIYGFSHREIAQQLELSENTVHRHLAKGVARCTQYMSKLGYARTPIKNVSVKASNHD
jgi:RNA polymerase sigma-70 factor (ECF subfamily)